ncbi:MAG: hypothetical protein GQ563_10020 [Desulfuromusa sp.]|nr:hypothetical protein [Desulfuromusa sp.]
MQPDLGMDPRKSLNKRLIQPAGIVLLGWLALNFGYDQLIYIENIKLYAFLADLTWVLLVICVGFSTLVIYPIMYSRGASYGERLLGSYLTPIGWCFKEFLRVNVSFTFAEAAFFAVFTSVSLLLLFGQLGFIGLSELSCRWLAGRKGSGRKVLAPIPVFSVMVALGAVYFIGLYDGGFAFHLMVKMFYRVIFL